MAWTAPRTYVTGEIVTAAIVNTDVRDNLRYLKGVDGLVTIQDGITMSGTGTASYLKVPVLTTTQRDAVVSPANGMIIFNSSVTKQERYEGGAWRPTYRRVYSSGTTFNSSGTAETTLTTVVLGTLANGDGVMLWNLYSINGTVGTRTFRMKLNGTAIDTYTIGSGIGSGGVNTYRPYQAMLNQSGTRVRYCVLAAAPAGGTAMYSAAGEIITSLDLSNGTLTITGQVNDLSMLASIDAQTVMEYP